MAQIITQARNIFLPSTLARIAIKDWMFPPHIQKLQKEILNTLYDDARNRLVCSMPVRHGKSFYVSLILACWFMLTHPNKNCWVVSYGSDFAIEWSSKVRDMVSRWGHLTGVAVDEKYQTASHFRMAYPHTGELRGLGITGALAGKGCHLCICDDLVKEFSEVSTEDARDKLYQRFHGELLSRIEPGGKCIMVMSRRHPQDLTGRLMASNPSLLPEDRWHQIEFPALNEDETEALWPERYPVKKLLAIKRDHELAGTFWQWLSLYQQDASAASELCEWPSKFWDNIHYDVMPESAKPRFRLMTLDPSVGKDRKKTDFAAMLYGVFDNNGCLWIEDPVLIRKPIEYVEDLAVEMMRRYSPDAFGIEVNGFQEVVADNIYKKAVPDKIAGKVAIYPYDSQEKKQIRIRMNLGPLLTAGNIRIKDTPQGRILSSQLRDFPVSQHDDGPDALSLMVRMLRDLTMGVQPATSYIPIEF